MPAVPTGARGAVITGWGAALPDKVVTNDDLARQRPRHQRRVDHRAHRHPRAPRRRHDRSLSIEAGRQAIERAGLAVSRSTAWCSPPPRRTAPCPPPRRRCRTRSGCAAAPSTSTPRAPGSRTRWSSPTAWSPSAPRRSWSSAPTRCRGSSTGRPQHRHPVRRRLRRRRARGGRGPRPVAAAGTSTPTGRPKICSTPRSAA